MKINELMIKKSLKFYENDLIKNVAHLILTEDVECGFVFNHSEQLIGIFTKLDLYEAYIKKQTNLKEIISKDFKVFNETDQIFKIDFGSSSCNPVCDSSGNIIGYITKEQYLNAYIKETQMKLGYYDAIFDSAHNGILSVDSLGKITSINPPAIKMANTTKEKAIGKFLTDVVLPTGLLEVVRTGKGHTEKYQAGNRVYITNRSPIMQDNEVVGAVGVFQDVSEIEFISNELESVKKIVNELNTIIESSSDGICIIDSKYKIKRMNDRFKQMVKIEENEVLPNSITRLLNGVALNKEQASVLHKDRQTGNSLIITCIPMIDENKQIGRTVINVKDMTEMEKLRDEIKEAKEMISNFNLQDFEGFIYQSQSMKKLINIVKQVAVVDATVLLTGESGVGKGEIANLIKNQSGRKEHPFVKVNCGAIPESLIESELFGYEPGAFTGASKKGKKGYFEQANGGIIFLDEIGELPQNLQVKLLNVLQDQEITRVGAEKPKKIDVRIIAATNRNLDEMVRKGQFREDLYYRLNVVPLLIPPLRSRLEDIQILTEYYSEIFSKKYNKKLIFTEDALKAFKEYDWPGNVRELVNIIERAFIIFTKETIDYEGIADLLQLRKSDKTSISSIISVDEIIPLKKAVNELEKQLILKALDEVKTYRKAAKLLDVNVSTVSRKMKRLTMDID